MQIPTTHITSSLIPQKASVYERQIAKLKQQRYRAEQIRLENEAKKFYKEMIEVTGKPRINRNINVTTPFYERTYRFEAQKTQKFKLLRQYQRDKQVCLTFYPYIDPASAYLVESRKALASTTKNLTSDYYLKTVQLQTVPYHYFMPEITDLAAKLPPDPHIYERLSYPKIQPTQQFSIVEHTSHAPRPTAREQELYAQRLHSEYAKFMLKKQELYAKADYDAQLHVDYEDKIQRDILAYHAEMRRLQRKTAEYSDNAADENCTFAPKINELSKLLVSDQPYFMERYDAELERIRYKQLLNDEKRRFQDEEEARSPFPQTRAHSSYSSTYFYQRQQDLLYRRYYARYYRELVRRQYEQEEVKYVLAHKEYQAPKVEPPANLHDQLFLLEQEERNRLADNLVNNNMDERTKKVLQLGNNVPIAAACMYDSIAQHVANVRRATEERRKRFEYLKLRD